MPLDLVTTTTDELHLRGGDLGLEPIEQPAGLHDRLAGRGDVTVVDRFSECRRPSEHAQQPSKQTFDTQPEDPEKICTSASQPSRITTRGGAGTADVRSATITTS
jgi:hypothetical protein